MKLDEKWKVVLAVGALVIALLALVASTFEVRCQGTNCITVNKITGWQNRRMVSH